VTETELLDDTPDDGLLHREFSAAVTTGDGRTVDVRIVPYGEQIEHNDGHGGVPKGVVYREEFVAGAFSHQLNAANRVLANAEHEEGIRGVVGHGIMLREEKDGLYGSFTIHETAAGETALILIREGIYDTVSLEARPRKSVRTRAGVIQRVKADLRGMAFSRFGAYKGSRVLALREEAETMIDEELFPTDLDPGIVARCAALGIDLPQRYQAHPAESDTPASTGTSEVGTRQTEDHADSEENEDEHAARNPVAEPD
jgi:HK97 family phage prohead protease